MPSNSHEESASVCTGPGVMSVRTISIALTSGFSTTWAKSMSTMPSLVMLKDRFVATLWPTWPDRSRSSMTTLPSIDTSKTRSPGSFVQSQRFAK